MPKYLVEMHDGRKFQVEADSQPTEDEVMAHLGGSAAPKPGEAAPMTRGVLGHPLSASDETPTLTNRVVNGLAENPALQGAAHPQSLGDTMSLFLPDMGAAAKVAARAAQPVVAPVARGAIRTLAGVGDVVDPDWIGLASPRGAKVIKIAQRARAAMDAPATIASVPRSLDSTARVLEPAAEAATEAAPSALSATERAQLAKQGYSPELIDKIATQAQAGGAVAAPKGGFIRAGRIEPVSSHAPASPDMVPVGGEAAYNAAHAQTAPVAPADAPLLPSDQIRRDLMDPEMVRKANEMQRGAAAAAPITPPDMAAQEARFNRGSERLGREQGMTRGDAQAQTDSVQGTRAETSLVAPWQAQQRMMAKMEALRQADPTGRSIVEYIDKAADPKTKAALINWERQSAFSAGRAPFYALAGAAVAPSVRDMLLQKMRAGVTGGSTPTQ